MNTTGTMFPTPIAAKLLIKDLAASEARMLDDLAVATSMLESYRTLAQEALHALASVTVQLQSAHGVIVRLREEMRRYKAAAVMERTA